MVNLKQLDKDISEIMKTKNILSWRDLRDNLPQYQYLGVTWYIKEKYEDFTQMDRPRHRYANEV